jgi:hypothetical protein
MGTIIGDLAPWDGVVCGSRDGFPAPAGSEARVYVVLGDGGCRKGKSEAACWRFGLDNLYDR